MGGTLNIGNVGSITTTESNTLGILGGWATFNNENWAVANGDTSAITALGTYVLGNSTAATYNNANIDVATATVVGTINANSLRFSGPSPKTLTLATGDNIIQSGGILVRSDVGNNISAITGGNLLGSSGGDLIIHQHNTNNTLSIGSIIKNNGSATGLTKSGAGTLVLNGVNTYTGNTFINAGTLQIGSNNIANNASLNSGSYAGNIFIGSGATLHVQSNANQVLSGVISGDGNLIKSYIGTLTLSGANTYTGKTSITILNTNGGRQNAGTLSVSSFNSVVGGGTTSSLGAPTTVANGTIDLGSGTIQSALTLQYAGAAATGETTDRVLNFVFNGSGTRTLDASGPSGVLKFTSPFTSNGVTSGSMILTGTGNGEIVGGLPFAFTGLTKSGNGTWTLGGTVGNIGTTTVSDGTLILSGTGSTNTGAYTVTGATTLRGTTATAFGDTTNINIGGSSILQLRGDANATFGKTTGGAAYTTSITATGATINVDQNTVAGTNQTFTLGAQTITSTAGTVNTTFTGANNTSLILGAVTDTTAVSGTVQFTNNISGGGSFTLGSFAGTRTGTPTLTFSGTGNTTVTGTISQTGTQALTYNGGGTLTLGGTNSYTGNTTISGGTLEVQGSIDNSSGITNNAALSFNSGSAQFYVNAITGSGSLTKNGAGTLTLSGTNSYLGNTTVANGILNTTKAAALAGYTTPGKVIVNGGTIGLQVGGSGWTTGQVDTMLSNATKTSGALGIDTTNGNLTQWTAFTTTNLGSTLGLTKLGANTLTLDQANTYNGTTTINAGTLLVNNTTGSGTGSGPVAVNGGTLGGTGTVGGATTVASGGTIRGGDGSAASGILNTRNVTINSGGTLVVTLGAGGINGSSSQLVVAGSGNNLNMSVGGTNSMLKLTSIGGFDHLVAGTYKIASITGDGAFQINGANQSTGTIATYTHGEVISSSVTFDVTGLGLIAGDTFSLNYDAGTKFVTLNFVPVPEPAAVVLVAVAALGLGQLVRRRKAVRAVTADTAVTSA